MGDERNLYFMKYSRGNCRKLPVVLEITKDEVICSGNK